MYAVKYIFGWPRPLLVASASNQLNVKNPAQRRADVPAMTMAAPYLYKLCQAADRALIYSGHLEIRTGYSQQP